MPDEMSGCLCESCTCTGCHDECFENCQKCGNPTKDCNGYQTAGEKFLSRSNDNGAISKFDYSNLDKETAYELQGITQCIAELQQSYAWELATQVGKAHDLLCGTKGACETGAQAVGTRGACETGAQAQGRNNQYSEATFSSWCDYIGIGRRTAYNLLNAYQLISKATDEQQSFLQQAPAKLLYAAGKSDAPEEAVRAVLDGDITTHAEYQRLKKELDAKTQEAEKLKVQCYSANERAADAESHRSALLDQQGEYIARIHELESRPIDVAVHELSEEDIARIRDEARSDYEEQLRLMESRCSQARAEASNQRSRADSLLEQLESRTQSDEAGKGMDYESCCNMAKDFAGTIDAFAKLYIFAAHPLPGDQFLAAAEPALAAAQDMLTAIRAQSTTQDYTEDDFL